MFNKSRNRILILRSNRYPWPRRPFPIKCILG